MCSTNTSKTIFYPVIGRNEYVYMMSIYSLVKLILTTQREEADSKSSQVVLYYIMCYYKDSILVQRTRAVPLFIDYNKIP